LFGVEVNVLFVVIEVVCARGGVVVAQLNFAMLWIIGDAVISIDLVDLVVEVEQSLSVGYVVVLDDDVLVIVVRVVLLVVDGVML